jgi:hypothetical protein
MFGLPPVALNYGIDSYASGSLIAAPTSRNNLSTYDFNTGTLFYRVPGVPLFLQDPNSGTIDPNNKHLILNPAAWVDAPAAAWGFGLRLLQRLSLAAPGQRIHEYWTAVPPERESRSTSARSSSTYSTARA